MLDNKKNKKADKSYNKKKHHDDQFFMRNPTLYKPGMENRYFSDKIMVQWIVYAFIHAYWVFMITHYALNLCSEHWNSAHLENG